MSIPVGVRRPPSAGKALRLRPLVQARRADASGVKGVPFMTTSTRPEVFLARQPPAERAADAWRLGGAGFFLFLKLALWNNDRIVRDRIHVHHYDLHADPE
jgi:hypothetical protein